jgi:hypothetical protein
MQPQARPQIFLINLIQKEFYMHKLTLSFISLFLLIISTNSLAIPVRHYFTGEVNQSSFGYEGKAVTGWYEYDFDNYTQEGDYQIGLFAYHLNVGDLEIVDTSPLALSSRIIYSGDAILGFGLQGEGPLDIASGNAFNMDVTELSFSDNSSSSTPDNYELIPETFDLSHMQTGSFEIYGHSPAILPDQSENVFWLKGSLQQVDVSHTVPEPSVFILMVISLGLLWKMRLQHRH